MTSFAYIHCKPDGTPFYVGKGSLRRAKYLGERNPYHQATVDKYGRENILIGMLECSSSDTAFALEKGIIKCLRRQNIKLTNFTDGGEGGVNPCPETRRRLSEAAKRRGVSKACQDAKIKAKRGKPLSEEQKRKQSESMRGVVFSDEHRRNISASAKRRGMPLKVLEAAHQAVKGRVQGSEERLKRREIMIAYWDKKGRKPKIEKTKGSCWDTRKPRAVSVDGVIYRTMKAAAEAIGVHSAALVYALKNSGVVKGHKVAEVKHDY